jgi:hypothetical protein
LGITDDDIETIDHDFVRFIPNQRNLVCSNVYKDAVTSFEKKLLLQM